MSGVACDEPAATARVREFRALGHEDFVQAFRVIVDQGSHLMYANSAVRIEDVATVCDNQSAPALRPTPTSNSALPLKVGAFDTLVEGLNYAAKGNTGFNYYSVRGEIKTQLTYTELREDAILLARKLVRLGLPRGARVALIAETIPDFHRFFFACQYAALVPVQLPVPMNLGGKEAYVSQLRSLIRSADPAMAVASEDMIGLLREATAEMDLDLIGTPEDFDDLAQSPDLRPVGRDDLCYIQYSSGSTSEPKGIIVTQRSVTSNARGIASYGLDVRDGDRCVSWLPLYHDMGMVGFCISPMLCQFSIDYLATGDFARRPLLWLRLFSENRGTIGFSPSFGYDLCRRQGSNGSAAGLDLSSWRVAGIGGDMVRAGVLDHFTETFAGKGFKRSAFVPSYGLAESTLAVSFAPLESDFETDQVDKLELAVSGRATSAALDAPAEASRSFVLCGSPMPDHELEIRDEADTPLGDRLVGRVLVRGPSVMPGFFRAPEKTSGVLSADGWLDTGDLGYMIDGALVITGRSKDLIICNGRNIWPQDIEWAAERLPGVRNGDVAAFSVGNSDGGEDVISVVQCRTMAQDARDELIKSVSTIVRKSVGIDSRVVLARPRSLPLTSSGKISRSQAKARYLAGMYDTL